MLHVSKRGIVSFCDSQVDTCGTMLRSRTRCRSRRCRSRRSRRSRSRRRWRYKRQCVCACRRGVKGGGISEEEGRIPPPPLSLLLPHLLRCFCRALAVAVLDINAFSSLFRPPSPPLPFPLLLLSLPFLLLFLLLPSPPGHNCLMVNGSGGNREGKTKPPPPQERSLPSSEWLLSPLPHKVEEQKVEKRPLLVAAPRQIAVGGGKRVDIVAFLPRIASHLALHTRRHSSQPGGGREEGEAKDPNPPVEIKGCETATHTHHERKKGGRKKREEELFFLQSIHARPRVREGGGGKMEALFAGGRKREMRLIDLRD